MIAELAQVSLLLALLSSLLLGVLPLWGAQANRQQLMDLARPAAQAVFFWVAVSFLLLITLFLQDDFSVAYVAAHSNLRLPAEFKIAGAWGGHEGSMLLSTLMLAGWTVAVALFSKSLPEKIVARTLGVLGLLCFGFLLFTAVTSNPFERLWPAAADGKDLNPLLQDPGMIFHPPLLFMGYVGTAVAFALAMAALMAGRLDASWARWMRPWVTASWCALTLGIALGSFWAYYELGWGGWWFWDPVENASFMPWLVSTALMHSLAVTEKRGAFRMWTALLAILAFALSLLGAFLVRSGVITSVHAFATDPSRGIFILAFLVIVVGSALTLFALKAPKSSVGADFHVVSREGALLANNLLLLVSTAAVLLGTLYPLFVDALGLGKISVGEPYFNAVFAPLMAPALVLMGIGPIARWRRAPLPELLPRLRWALLASVLVAVLGPLLMGELKLGTALGFLLGAWIIFTSLSTLIARAIGNRDRSPWRNLMLQPAGTYGMLLAHVGVAAFVIGVTGVRGYQVEQDLKLDIGQSVEVGGYQFLFSDLRTLQGQNYQGVQGTFEVSRNGKLIDTLRPEKRLYNSSQMPMTEAAIRPRLNGDIYISLAEPVNPLSWGVLIYVKPFVSWIWLGCVLMALGGFWSMADRRYRSAREPAQVPRGSGQLPA